MTTWSQVAGIMNLFSKWENGWKPSGDNQENYNPNLKEWVAQTSESNKWIETDLTGNGSSDDTNVTKKWSSTKPDSSPGTYDQTIQESSSTLYRWHNNIVWTYKNENGTITIEGTQANLYKSKAPTGSTFYQTAFKTKEGNSTEIDETANITIKLIIVPGTPAESTRKN